MKNFVTLFLGFLIFGSLFVDSAMSDLEQENVIAVVLDTSGSMARYVTVIKDALDSWIDELETDGKRIMILRFDQFSEVLANTSITIARDKAALKAIVEGIQFQGAYTNLDEGFRGIASELFENEVHESTILFITDKQADPNPEKGAKDAKRSLLDIIKDFPKSHKIWIIGLKPNQELTVDNLQNAQLISVTTTQSSLSQVLTTIRMRKNLLDWVLDGTDSHQIYRHQEETKAISQKAETQTKTVPESTVAKKTSWVWILGLVSGVLLTGFMVLLLKKLLGNLRKGKARNLIIQMFGKPDSQETFRVSQGDSIRVGRGPCDYILPQAQSRAVLSFNGDAAFQLAPESEKDQIVYQGKMVESPLPIESGERFLVDGSEVVVI